MRELCNLQLRCALDERKAKILSREGVHVAYLTASIVWLGSESIDGVERASVLNQGAIKTAEIAQYFVSLLSSFINMPLRQVTFKF